MKKLVSQYQQKSFWRRLQVLLSITASAGILVSNTPALAMCGMVYIETDIINQRDYGEQLASVPARKKNLVQPSQVAFIKWDPEQKLEAITVEPSFQGNTGEFGMLIPTPSRPKIDEMPRDFFRDLEVFTLLMPAPTPLYINEVLAYHNAPGYLMPTTAAANFEPSAQVPKGRAPTVRVLEAGVVGALDYKIVSATDAKDLFDWMDKNKYAYHKSMDTLRFYIDKKWFFTVMKIDPKQMRTDSSGKYLGHVSPTRFTFNSERCIYPLRITRDSIEEKTDALFYVEAPKEMDLPEKWSWLQTYQDIYSNLWRASATQANDGSMRTAQVFWSKKLDDADMEVLEDPSANFAKVGHGYFPPGSQIVPISEFLQLAPNYQYLQSENGVVVRYDRKLLGHTAYDSPYAWYQDRISNNLNGLARLKGHLQKNSWLTKFQKTFYVDEMNEDMAFNEIPQNSEVTFTRLLPTSSVQQVAYSQEHTGSNSSAQFALQTQERDEEGLDMTGANYYGYADPSKVMRLGAKFALLDEEGTRWVFKAMKDRSKKESSNTRNDSNGVEWLDPPGDPYRRYTAYLAREILTRWQHQRTSKELKSLLLNLTLKKDGSLDSVKVQRSSGSDKIDDEAVAAVQACQFKPYESYNFYAGYNPSPNLQFLIGFGEDRSYDF